MKYRINNKYVEHGCCYNTAIVYNCEEGNGSYGSNIALLCECNSDDAQFILNALNSYKEINKAIKIKQTKQQIKEEIMAKLVNLTNEINNNDNDYYVHEKADDLLFEFLIKLGHQDMIDIYNKISKWED